MARSYELLLIVHPDREMTEKRAQDIVTNLLEKVGGKLVSVAVWGKRALAYPIRKMTEGVYLLATVEGDSLTSAALEKEVRKGSEILRFLLIAR